MANRTAAYPGSSTTVVTKANANAGQFIPEIWSDEIIAAYENSLVIKPLVRSMSMMGKKGDTIHIPKPERGTVSAKAAATAVTIQQSDNSSLQIDINQHFEYSRLIEDITDVQALSSLRRFYTEDAGYQLAKKVDTDLLALANSSDVAASNKQMFTANGIGTVVAGSVNAFNDAGFRAAIQLLDDADVPMMDRYYIIPPGAKNTILGIDKFINADYIDGRPTMNGRIGNIYGVDVYMSTNLSDGSGGASSATSKHSVLAHRDAFVIAEQLGVRTQTQYKQEYLADLMTSDTIYGVKTYRPENVVQLDVLV